MWTLLKGKQRVSLSSLPQLSASALTLSSNFSSQLQLFPSALTSVLNFSYNLSSQLLFSTSALSFSSQLQLLPTALTPALSFSPQLPARKKRKKKWSSHIIALSFSRPLQECGDQRSAVAVGREGDKSVFSGHFDFVWFQARYLYR